MRKIIFLCTGNVCRSPMAEGILRNIAKEKNLPFEVDSYGIIDLDGQLPSAEAVNACISHGIDISGHRSQIITRDAIDEADLILVMERSHIDWLVRHFGENVRQKSFLITEYRANGENFPNIPDPIGASQDYYDKVFEMLRSEIERIFSCDDIS